jgi:hypothetical protein
MQIITYDPFTGTKIGTQTELDFGTVMQSSHPVKPILFKLQPDSGETPTDATCTLTGSGWAGNSFGIYNDATFAVIQSGDGRFQPLIGASLLHPIPDSTSFPISNYVWLDVDIPVGQTGTTYAGISIDWS